MGLADLDVGLLDPLRLVRGEIAPEVASRTGRVVPCTIRPLSNTPIDFGEPVIASPWGISFGEGIFDVFPEDDCDDLRRVMAGLRFVEAELTTKPGFFLDDVDGVDVVDDIEFADEDSFGRVGGESRGVVTDGNDALPEIVVDCAGDKSPLLGLSEKLNGERLEADDREGILASS